MDMTQVLLALIPVLIIALFLAVPLYVVRRASTNSKNDRKDHK